MSIIVIGAIVCLSITMAYRHTVPIGIIAETEDEEVVAIIKVFINVYNNDSANRIIIKPVWQLTDFGNNCDLIRAICRCLDAGVYLLIGSSTARSYNIIQSYSHALQVPFVIYSQTSNMAGDGYDYDVSISPSYVTAISDVIKYFSWDKIFYVFDSDDALWELQRLHDSFRSHTYSLVVDARRLRNVTSSHEFLRHMDRFSTRSSVKRIVLNLANRDTYQTVLNQLVDVGMNRYTYHYLLAGHYIEDLNLRSFLYGGVNVTGFRLPVNLAEMSSYSQKSTLESMTAIPNSTDAALASDALRLVQQALNSLLDPPNTRHHRQQTFQQFQVHSNLTRGVKCWTQPPVPWVHGSAVREALLKSMVSGITGPVVLDQHGVRTGYKLDLMHLEYRTPLRKVGTWTLKERVISNLPRPVISKGTGSPNRTRVATTILEKPFVMMKCPEDGNTCLGNDRFEGYCIDLLRLVAEKVNFDYTIQLVKDNTYGARLADGTWNGMIGELLTNKADLAVASLTITEIRERFVDFSKPFMQLGTSIMIKKPEKEKGGVFSFKDPLSDSVWLAIICGFLGVSLVLFLVGRFSAYEKQEGSDMSKPAFSLANTVWFSLGALMQQGSDIYPR